MTDEEAILLVTRFICRGRQVDPSQISADTNLVNDLGFDSLDAAELLAALHQETGMELNACSIQDVKTVNDLAQNLVSVVDRREVGQPT